MARKPDPFVIDEENPEWTPEATAEARPVRATMPGSKRCCAKLWKRGSYDSDVAHRPRPSGVLGCEHQARNERMHASTFRLDTSMPTILSCCGILPLPSLLVRAPRAH